MYRLIILGGTDEVNSLPVLVGKHKLIMLDGNELRNQWEVQSPSGTKDLIVPDFSKECLRISQTSELGIYNVYKNGELYTSFATELHPNEIVSNQVSEDEFDILFEDLEYKFIIISDNFVDVFNEIRNGKALWKVFLIMAIILFLIETWIGRPTLNNNKN